MAAITVPSRGALDFVLFIRLRRTKEQAAAYTYFKKHEKAVTQAVIRKVFKEYPQLRKKYRIKADGKHEFTS